MAIVRVFRHDWLPPLLILQFPILGDFLSILTLIDFNIMFYIIGCHGFIYHHWSLSRDHHSIHSLRSEQFKSSFVSSRMLHAIYIDLLTLISCWSIHRTTNQPIKWKECFKHQVHIVCDSFGISCLKYKIMHSVHSGRWLIRSIYEYIYGFVMAII